MKVLTFILGQLMTNTYVCIDEKSNHAVVIDPGLDGDGIFEKIASRSLNVTHIILTHGHFDHALGVKTLKAKTGALVAVGKEDAPLLSDKVKNSACIFFPQGFDYPDVAPDILLGEGDIIRLGEESFSVIATPGHTKGGICLDTGEFLFCGDTLFANGFGRTDLYGGSLSELLCSIEKISKIPGERKVCPGHGNSTTLTREKANIGDIIMNYRA